MHIFVRFFFLAVDTNCFLVQNSPPSPSPLSPFDSIKSNILCVPSNDFSDDDDDNNNRNLKKLIVKKLCSCEVIFYIFLKKSKFLFLQFSNVKK